MKPATRRFAVAGAALAVGAVVATRTRRGRLGVAHLSRTSRNVELARLGATVGATYATTAARKVFASAERRETLDRERELRTSEAVADRLGQMKGALMKLGQMASYLDEGMPQPLRDALAQLQSQAPPMSAELAAEVHRTGARRRRPRRCSSNGIRSRSRRRRSGRCTGRSWSTRAAAASSPWR